MEVHPRVNSVLAKRLWNFLRIAFYMMRKGLVSKRKLLMDMNLMMKRGKVLGKKTLENLIHHHRAGPVRGYGLQEYEFSCSNSPNPVFFHVGINKIRKLHHHYFPCINAHDEEEEPEALVPPAPPVAVVPVHKIEYPSPEYSFNFPLDGGGAAGDEKLSPMLSPFSVRVSNYSGVDEAADGGSSTPRVDAEAEEFIRRFYEQLRLQRRTALLQYQETEFQEMLARGC